MPSLFDSWILRDVTLANRIAVSPMCQYSSTDGFANDWHLIHLGSRAVGGAGLVLTEATAVAPEGRISPDDLGIWSDAHVEGLARVARFIASTGSVPGMQIAHAGRKASTWAPWKGTGAVPIDQGGWRPVGPSDEAFSPEYHAPRSLAEPELAGIAETFAGAARRALAAGMRVLEVHAAHGYLLHQFLSPLTNRRTDAYGGSFDGRVRLCLEVVDAVRRIWPERLPLFVRLSVTDWMPGGWDVEQSVELATRLRQHGVDVVDCSSGGAVTGVQIPVGPGYQVPLAERIRREGGVATGAVGLITSGAQADAIIRGSQADCVLVGRACLRDPYWPLHAAADLGHAVAWPQQYLRAAPTPSR